MKGVLAAAPPSSSFYPLQSKTQTNYHYSYGLISVGPRISCLSHTKLNHYLCLRLGTAASESTRFSVRCNSSSAGPGGPGSGNNDSRSVLDAFFLGKALAEALNERVESAVGEFLSAVGRLQAEQQKQIQDFQEDVLIRAKKAKEQAAREAIEEQGLVPKPNAVDTTSVNDGVTLETSPTANAYETGSNPVSKDPVLGLSSDD